MSTTDEADRRYPMHAAASSRQDLHNAGYQAFIAGAEWQASRKVEASTDEREGLRLAWIEGNGVYSDVTNAILAAGYRKPKAAPRINADAPIPYAGKGPQYMADTAAPSDTDRPTEEGGVWGSYVEYLRRLEDAVRASQPVQVEITEETVERMARMLFAQTTEARSGFTWPINGDWGRERDMEQARKVLEYVLTPAALGGERKPTRDEANGAVIAAMAEIKADRAALGGGEHAE